MSKITVQYNPYLVKTTFKMDGKDIPNTFEFVQKTEGRRLADWVDDVLPLIYKRKRENGTEFDFYGTVQDAEDFKRAVEAFNQKGNHCFTVTAHTSEIRSNPREELRKLYEEGKQGPFADLFNSVQMRAAFERATAPEFEVNVIATMSSGKSTLINALLGKNIIPSKHEACTATIARIEDRKDQSTFTAIRYDKDNKLLTPQPVMATRELLTEWNDDEKTSTMIIRGNIPTISRTKDSSYVFIDTPGPNNSRNEEHKRTTFEAIKSKPLSMIIYVLNAENPFVTDDAFFLKAVAETMTEGGRNAQDRFIFVLNRVDAYRNGDDSVAVSVKKAEDYLRSHGIPNPLIIPVSAKFAKLLRLKTYSPDNLSEDDIDELDLLSKKFTRNEDLHLHRYCMREEIKRNIEMRLKTASEDEKLLIYTGLPVLEEYLKSFLNRYALPAKMEDAVASFDQVLRRAESIQNLNNILQKSNAEIKAAADALNAYASDKETLDKVAKFKEKVNAVTYKESDATATKITNILQEQQMLLTRLESTLKQKGLSVSAAERICTNAEVDCKEFALSIETTLKRALNSECFYQMDQLRKEYEKSVMDRLNKAFPGNNEVRELEISVMKMPKTEEMVRENTHGEWKERIVWRERAKWSLWRLFGSTQYKDTESYYDEKVDLTPAHKEVFASVTGFTQKIIANFRKQAGEALDESKKLLLNLMETKEKELAGLGAKISAAANNKKAKEKEQKDAEEKIAWYKDFQSRLHKILEL